MWITGGVAVVLIFLDQLTKILAVQTNVNSLTLIPHVLTISLTYNTGAAWGMLENTTWLLALISFFAAIGLGYLCRKNDWKHGKFGAIALTMALAGCIGNLIDRFLTVIGVYEGVIDMISFDIFDWFMSLFRMSASIFNVADAFLVVGLIMFCIDYIFFYDKRMMKYGGVQPNKKKTQATLAIEPTEDAQAESQAEEMANEELEDIPTSDSDPDLDSKDDYIDDELEEETEKE